MIRTRRFRGRKALAAELATLTELVRRHADLPDQSASP